MTEDERSLQKRGEVGSFLLSFGEKIRTARIAAHLSQGELGERLASAIGRSRPFSQAYISELERKSLEINSHIANALSAIVETPVIDSPTTEEVFSGINPSIRRGKTLQESSEQSITSQPEHWIRFSGWKKEVGLPQEFPQLRPLEGDELLERFYEGEGREGTAEYIHRFGADTDIAVVMAKGHGVTTLARHIYETMGRRSVEFGRIPVYFSIDKMDKDKLQDPRKVAEDAIRKELFRSLYKNRGQYAKQWHFDTLQVLGDFKGHPLTAPVSQILNHLREKAFSSIGVVVQLDLSSKDSYFDLDKHLTTVAVLVSALGQIQKEVDALDQRAIKIPESLATVIYFGDKASIEEVEKTRGKTFEEEARVDCPFYKPTEIFQMLAMRYSPDIHAVRAIDLQRNLDRKRFILPDKPYTPSERLSKLVSPLLLMPIGRPDMPIVEMLRTLEVRLSRLFIGNPYSEGLPKLTRTGRFSEGGVD